MLGRKFSAVTAVWIFAGALWGGNAVAVAGEGAVPGGGTGRGIAVGNRTCPVTGEKIQQQGKVTIKYKGKIYNLCCAGCVKQFKRDPEKYLGKMKKGQGASAARR